MLAGASYSADNTYGSRYTVLTARTIPTGQDIQFLQRGQYLRVKIYSSYSADNTYRSRYTVLTARPIPTGQDIQLLQRGQYLRVKI